MKTTLDIQKDFQEDQNEIINDVMGLFNKYYVKRQKAELELKEIELEKKKAEAEAKKEVELPKVEEQPKQ